MRRFVIGDIHGGFKALLQVLERSKFDKRKDHLIALGDATDGWSQVPETFEELLTLKNLTYILGNHDEWFMEFAEGKMEFNLPDDEGSLWLNQGGQATVDAYINKLELFKKHYDYLKENGKLYHIEKDINSLFVHAGYDEDVPLEEQSKDILCWDRWFWKYTTDGYNLSKKFNKVFIGHTPTLNYNNYKLPMYKGNVWDLDTGAAYTGKLTIMNIDTEEYFQSDVVWDLYPDEMGRNKVQRKQ